MKPEALRNEQIQPKQKRAVRDLLDAVAGTISAAEANELRKTVKI